MEIGKGSFMLFNFLLRLALIYVAVLVDQYSETYIYTDVDYYVFSDAATKVYNGGSPYERNTYRYTPLVAYICLLNNYIHPLSGKVVFIVCDVLVGYILWEIVECQNVRKKGKTIYYVAFWMLNPLVISLSTRGSNDTMITLLIFASAYFILKKQYVVGALIYGLSVHFKIYPIIYSVVFYLYIDHDASLLAQNKKFEALWRNFFTWNRVKFTLISAGTFFALGLYFYWVYGYEFLYEAYLYHFVRKDNRHNMSIYYYMIYQLFDEQQSATLAILTFIPQWGVVLVTGLCLYYDMFFAMLIQTWAFVSFNKVQTAQYILWYLTLIPIHFINSNITHRMVWVSFLILMFACAGMNWAFWAYNFEFLGQHTIEQIQHANLVWFLTNMFIIYSVIENYRLALTVQIDDAHKVKND